MAYDDARVDRYWLARECKRCAGVPDEASFSLCQFPMRQVEVKGRRLPHRTLESGIRYEVYIRPALRTNNNADDCERMHSDEE